MMRARIMPTLKSLPSVSWTLFTVCFLTFAYFYQGGGQNESARFDSIRAFIDHGNAIIDPWAGNSTDIISISGHFYSGKAPGTFFLGLVPFWLSDEILTAIGVAPGIRYHFTTYFSSVLTISLLGALLVVILYWLGLRLKANDRDSAAAALTLALGTSLFPFSTLFFSHVATAFCLLFGYYHMLAYRQDIATDPNRTRRLLWAGLALGFSMVLEYPAVIAVVILLGYFVASLISIEHPPKQIGSAVAKLLLSVVIGLTPLLLYNILVFNNPFYITYEFYAHSETEFAAHKLGILGIRVPLWDWSAWPQFWSNLREITYKPLRGLFFNNPALILIFIGFPLLFRARRDLDTWLALIMFLAYLSFNACFGNSITYWGGGASFGPRNLLVSLPFLSPPLLACLGSRRWRPAFVTLALVSILFCLMATAVEPRTGYGPDNPVFYFYLPRFMTGLLALNSSGVFSPELLTFNSIAFNWGKLCGLPSALQLAPLYLAWLAAMWNLDRRLKIERWGFFFAASIFVFVALGLPLGTLA